MIVIQVPEELVQALSGLIILGAKNPQAGSEAVLAAADLFRIVQAAVKNGVIDRTDEVKKMAGDDAKPHA